MRRHFLDQPPVCVGRDSLRPGAAGGKGTVGGTNQGRRLIQEATRYDALHFKLVLCLMRSMTRSMFSCKATGKSTMGSAIESNSITST